MSNFKSINNQGNCSSLSYLYLAAKNANSVASLSSSNMADFDGLIGTLNYDNQKFLKFYRFNKTYKSKI
jgi:hypothetical protein